MTGSACLCSCMPCLASLCCAAGQTRAPRPTRATGLRWRRDAPADSSGRGTSRPLSERALCAGAAPRKTFQPPSRGHLRSPPLLPGRVPRRSARRSSLSPPRPAGRGFWTRPFSRFCRAVRAASRVLGNLDHDPTTLFSASAACPAPLSPWPELWQPPLSRHQSMPAMPAAHCP